MLRLLFLCTFELLFYISFMFAIRYCFHLYNFISYFSTCLFFHNKMKLFFFHSINTCCNVKNILERTVQKESDLNLVTLMTIRRPTNVFIWVMNWMWTTLDRNVCFFIVMWITIETIVLIKQFCLSILIKCMWQFSENSRLKRIK